MNSSKKDLSQKIKQVDGLDLVRAAGTSKAIKMQQCKDPKCNIAENSIPTKVAVAPSSGGNEFQIYLYSEFGPIIAPKPKLELTNLSIEQVEALRKSLKGKQDIALLENVQLLKQTSEQLDNGAEETVLDVDPKNCRNSTEIVHVHKRSFKLSTEKEASSKACTFCPRHSKLNQILEELWKKAIDQLCGHCSTKISKLNHTVEMNVPDNSQTKTDSSGTTTKDLPILMKCKVVLGRLESEPNSNPSKLKKDSGLAEVQASSSHGSNKIHSPITFPTAPEHASLPEIVIENLDSANPLLNDTNPYPVYLPKYDQRKAKDFPTVQIRPNAHLSQSQTPEYPKENFDTTQTLDNENTYVLRILEYDDSNSYSPAEISPDENDNPTPIVLSINEETDETQPISTPALPLVGEEFDSDDPDVLTYDIGEDIFSEFLDY